jgi:PhoH-like ATPase
MRLKATLDLEMQSYEFNASQIIGAKPFDGRHIIELTTEEWGDYSFDDAVESEILQTHSELILSRIPKNSSHYALVSVKVAGVDGEANFLLQKNKLKYVSRKTRVSQIVARTLEQDVAAGYLLKSNSELPIVSLGGGAGTGKTLLTIAAGLSELKKGAYQKIVVFRSLHEMGQGQEMGFLPGGVDEKMEAWAGAIFDALDVLAAATRSNRKKSERTDEMAKAAVKVEAEKLRAMVEIAPITYLRGRSLANTYIVLEEAQNFSRSELLHILSRLGEGSKIVLTWDADQVDNKYLHAGKNADIWSVVESLKGEDLFAHITLMKTERSRVAELASRLLAG